MLPAISKEGLAQELGVSEGTIDGWMKRDLTRGVHYVVKGHTALFYIEEIMMQVFDLNGGADGARNCTPPFCVRLCSDKSTTYALHSGTESHGKTFHRQKYRQFRAATHTTQEPAP